MLTLPVAHWVGVVAMFSCGGGVGKVLQNPSFCGSLSQPHQRYEYLSPLKKWPRVYRFLC